MEVAILEPQEVRKVDSPDRIKELVDLFIASQDKRDSTRRLLRRTLRQYFNWIAKKGYQLSEITIAHLIEYKEELLGSGKSSLTVASYINSVRYFYEWAEASKLYPNIGKGVKAPKRKQEFRKSPLYPTQVNELLSYFQDKTLRDLAIVNLLVRTGLRTIEVVRANVEDISYKHIEGKEVRILLVQGKGRDDRDEYVKLKDKTYQAIVNYLATREKIRATDPLFTSTSNNSSGGRLTTRTVSYIAKEGLKAIGLNSREFTAHSLRHSAITNCRRGGGTPEQAQALGRHRSPVTTQIYDRFFREEERLNYSGEDILDSLYQ
jgi:integrase/recombinase XerC/integrase/recombinase XerD